MRSLKRSWSRHGWLRLSALKTLPTTKNDSQGLGQSYLAEFESALEQV